jgi:hypothetical protein
MISTVPNHALRPLRAGKLAIDLGMHQARTVGVLLCGGERFRVQD